MTTATPKTKKELNRLESIWKNSMKMWICRNTNGSLALFEDEPEYDDVWDWWTPSRTSKQNRQIYLNMMLFPEVTFENSPMEVELVIKK